MKILKQIEERVSDNTSRRGFFRIIIHACASMAAFCAGLSANALIARDCWETNQYSNYNNDTCNGSENQYCTDYSSTWGCTIVPGLPACTVAQGCTGTTGSVSSSNCGNGFTNSGWWDCCCDGTKIRCRDCTQNGILVCICRANIGSC